MIVLEKKIKQKFDWTSFVGLNSSQIEIKAREILAEMTLEEKLKQMVGKYTRLQAFLSLFKKSNRSKIYAAINRGSENKRLRIPPITFSDGPRGVVGFLKNIRKPTCFPVAIARAASFDIELEERIGNAIGIEMRIHNNNFFGGVCINQMYYPRGGRSQESYGEDTCLLGEMGSALIKGVQKHRIMACAKHYAVNNQETTRMKIDVTVDERTLREVFLPHFKKGVDVGVVSFMAAYNHVNGIPCGHHSHLIRDILKGDWNFKGFVISDWVFCIRDGKEAILGGMDIEMPWEMKMKGKKMKELVKSGEISIELIDDAVLRILRNKIRFSQSKDNDEHYPERLSACEKHIQLALEAARKGIILLENNDSFLPLRKDLIKRIGVFGEYADKPLIGDKGSSRVSPEYVTTIFKGIQKICGNGIEVVKYEESDLGKARTLAKSLDVVVFVAGFDYRDEGESLSKLGGDRKFMTLKPKDVALIEEIAKINSNIIVVMHSGGSIITESWRDKVKAILMFWYGGMEGGTALAEILFGDVNPSGKCPCTFPKSEDQLPSFDREAIKATYDYYHGYRYIDKHDYEPRYPFGFGLSYTHFSYSNAFLDKNEINKDEQLNVSVDISNIGNLAGEEVVQLYIGAQDSKVKRFVKELKRFKRIFIRPGETITIKFIVNVEELAYYEVSKSSWIIESTSYKIFIGSSSADKDLIEIPFIIK